jgi:transposase
MITDRKGKRWEVISLHLRGVDWSTIQKTTGMRASSAKHWLEVYKRTGKVDDFVEGRGRKTLNENHDEAVKRAVALASEGLTSKAICSRLQAEGFQCTSDRTTRYWLHNAGYRYQAVRTKPLLRQGTKDNRLGWAKVHKKDNFKRVIFTDSKIFRGCLTATDAKKLKAWAPEGEAAVMEVAKGANYQVHVYGGISHYGATELHFVTGTTGLVSKYKHTSGKLKGSVHKGVCSREYKDVLLSGGAGASMGLIEDARAIFEAAGVTKYAFQQDNPNIHLAAIAILQENCPRLLPWPATSPDLSLIENVWSLVEFHLRRDYTWHDLESFKAALTQAWQSVTSDKEYRQNLFNSMKRRLQQCINKGGDIVK